MTKDENLHVGHRQRMTEKIFDNPAGLCKHELLEILLFSLLPRIDTNKVAHKLLREFGSFEKLFSATAEELTAIDGVGKNTASKIILIGQIINTVNQEKKDKLSFKRLFDYEKEMKDCFKGLRTEKFMVILLDSNFYQITNLTFESFSRDTVSARIDEITHAFAVHCPSYVILAHNHPSGNPSPSPADDLTTAKFYILCSMHGVMLSDHVIITDEKIYSYFIEGRMDDYSKKYKLETLLKKSEE